LFWRPDHGERHIAKGRAEACEGVISSLDIGKALGPLLSEGAKAWIWAESGTNVATLLPPLSAFPRSE
jgi:hypothetical protein